MSARKMRLVADLVRGKDVYEAMNILQHTKNEAAEWLYKTLMSAIANWEYKNDMAYAADEFDLYIKRLLVDEGSFLKRFRPAPHGRAHRIKKRTNHVTIVVENRKPLDNELQGDYEETEEALEEGVHAAEQEQPNEKE